MSRRAGIAIFLTAMVWLGVYLARPSRPFRSPRGSVTAEAVSVTQAAPADTVTRADVSIMSLGDRDQRAVEPGERTPQNLDVPRIPEPPARPPVSDTARAASPAPASADTAKAAGAASDLAGSGGADSSGAAANVVNAAPAAGSDARLVPPVLLKAAWLEYPDEALKRKSQGRVEVRILVGVDGSVTTVELTEAVVDTVLARAATESARAMRFRPATRGGRPVPVWYNYRFDFTLPRSG